MAKLPCSLASVLLAVIAIHVSSNTVSTSTDGKYQMPDACKNQTYCFEKGDHYPDDIVQKLNLNFEIENSIGTRKGGEADEPECPYKSANGPIYYIVDSRNVVRVVVQIPGKFPQTYEARWCQKEGKITGDTRHFVALTDLKRYDLECVSTTMTHSFVVLSTEADDKTEIATTSIPVCCKCRYDHKSRRH